MKHLFPYLGICLAVAAFCFWVYMLIKMAR